MFLFTLLTIIQNLKIFISILQSGSLQSGIDSSNKDTNVGMDPITPSEVREAVRRFFANNSSLSPYSKIRSPISQRLFAA